MSEPPRSTENDEREEAVRTPFDNPLFLPVLLWIFALWFGYDAFFNADEHMQESSTLWFNRIGFPVATLFAIYYTVRGVRERRDEQSSSDSDG